jgi:hypothetical protein
VEEKDGKPVESLSKHMCGALYGQIAPARNMSKSPKEWQTFDITFRAPRGEKAKVTKKAWVTVIWIGEQVIDTEVPNGTSFEPGPILLQGDHPTVIALCPPANYLRIRTASFLVGTGCACWEPAYCRAGPTLAGQDKVRYIGPVARSNADACTRF